MGKGAFTRHLQTGESVICGKFFHYTDFSTFRMWNASDVPFLNSSTFAVEIYELISQILSFRL